MASLFEQDRIFLTPACEHALREIPSYRSRPVTPSAPAEKPLKENDDTCDAIRYACWHELGHTAPFVRTPSIYIDNVIEASRQNESYTDQIIRELDRVR